LNIVMASGYGVAVMYDSASHEGRRDADMVKVGWVHYAFPSFVIASEARQSNPTFATGLPRFARNDGV
jgi:hypothetical protein